MSPVTDAADMISEALAAVTGVRHHRQMYGLVDPPATVLPPPALRRRSMSSDPTDASWVVALVVDRGERSQEQLMELEPRVVEALYALEDVAVGESRPGTYPSGGVELPAYLIDIDVAL
jgi:hypothetical protein